MAQAPTQEAIAAKKAEVNALYEQFGCGSEQYEKAFDELHDMRMLRMAADYRTNRGLPPNAKTPYC